MVCQGDEGVSWGSGVCPVGEWGGGRGGRMGGWMTGLGNHRGGGRGDLSTRGWSARDGGGQPGRCGLGVVDLGMGGRLTGEEG